MPRRAAPGVILFPAEGRPAINALMSKTLRVGMIGYRFMGKAHSNAWRQVNRFFPELPALANVTVAC